MIQSLKWMRMSRLANKTITLQPTTLARVRHQGTVATITPALMVCLEDGVVHCPAHVMSHYTPVVGDKVMIDDQGGDLVVIGKYSS